MSTTSDNVKETAVTASQDPDWCSEPTETLASSYKDRRDSVEGNTSGTVNQARDGHGHGSTVEPVLSIASQDCPEYTPLSDEDCFKLSSGRTSMSNYQVFVTPGDPTVGPQDSHGAGSFDKGDANGGGSQV